MKGSEFEDVGFKVKGVPSSVRLESMHLLFKSIECSLFV